jgi:hypothetical protein
MDSEFLRALRSAIESGDFHQMGGLYAADATFAGFLPGGIRHAVGPDEIADLIAAELGPVPTLVEWRPLRPTTVDFEIIRGEPPERKRQIHKVRIVDGLIESHWAYPVMLDTISMGDSGARHRRVERPDGTIVFEKLISPSHDWIMRATHDLGREATLWLDGPLRSLPPSIEYPLLSAERVGDGWLLTTRDVSTDLLPAEPTIGVWREVIDRLGDLHEHFDGAAADGLCSIEDRLAIFSERTALTEIDGSDRYPKLLQHGWREVPGLLPRDLAAPILALAQNPAPLVGALSQGPLTLIHGDAFLTNFGVRDNRLIALDWALAAWAPAELEFTWLLSGTGDLRDEVLEAVRAALGPSLNERRLRIALLYECIFELAGLSYSVATASPDQAEVPTAALSWWLSRAREGLVALNA